MQPLDNDMDDLFREAANNYPLRISGADWSKVAGALSSQKTAAAIPAKNKKTKYFWLLLLLLIPFVCNVYNNVSKNPAEQNVPGTASGSGLKKIIPDQKIVRQNINIINPDVIPLPPPSLLASSSFSSDLSSYVLNKKIIKKDAAINVNIASPESETENENNSGDKTNVVVPDITDATTSGDIKKEENNSPAGQKKDIAAEPKKDSAVSKPTKKQSNKEKPEKKLYLNILVGPDASRVKNMSSGKMGGSAGITLGFNINKHFAMEAGALYSVKHYSTEYTYFDNSKTQWPSNRIIKTIDGTCKMVELPVTLRYNFNATKNSRFFIASGLSSYLMREEDYEYAYTLSSGPAENEVYKTYKKSGNNIFSVLQLSAGWQRNIGFGSVRIQPYYNVPLHGVGIGKLPLSGAGVLAGISVPIK